MPKLLFEEGLAQSWTVLSNTGIIEPSARLPVSEVESHHPFVQQLPVHAGVDLPPKIVVRDCRRNRSRVVAAL